MGDISADRELEKPVRFYEFAHSRRAPDTHFESLDSETIDRLALEEPYIFTKRSRIQGKVAAALTEWRDGVEIRRSSLQLSLRREERCDCSGYEPTRELEQFGQYLNSFKLKSPPFCPFDPEKMQDILLVIEECNMFIKERAGVEQEIEGQM
ncbi:hypothetical protein EVAR_75502_1 [Eumeta japonica]|uniref:Uncharacterized protein n=1 Tax=Eumeta variegata TaxID=151549 RepID=A0A4C1TMP1_EUMVA|nr:hypothetical protein EVAR_75502_1 [Eumeta japonica]